MSGIFLLASLTAGSLLFWITKNHEIPRAFSDDHIYTLTLSLHYIFSTQQCVTSMYTEKATRDCKTTYFLQIRAESYEWSQTKKKTSVKWIWLVHLLDTNLKALGLASKLQWFRQYNDWQHISQFISLNGSAESGFEIDTNIYINK